MTSQAFVVIVITYLAIGAMWVTWNFNSFSATLVWQRAEERGKLGWVLFGGFIASLLWPVGVLVHVLMSQKK